MRNCGTRAYSFTGVQGSRPCPDLFGKHLGIAGGLEHFLRQEAGGRMVSMAIGGAADENRVDHKRAHGSNHANRIRKHALMAPLIERLLERFRKTVIHHGREILPVEAVVAAGLQKFFGANQPETRPRDAATSHWRRLRRD